MHLRCTDRLWPSQSAIDAEEKVDRLYDLVEQTLKQNVMPAERLCSFQTGSTVASNEAAVPVKPSESGQTTTEVDHAPADESAADDAHQEPRRFVFEELLMKSRVYRDMAFDGSDTFSVLRSAVRTGTWSMLSGLSLSQMSNIAILALPIYESDLNNKERYDFETITEEPVIFVEGSALDPAKESPSSRRRILSSWRKRLGNEPREDVPPAETARIFGVEIATSIRYANVAISLMTRMASHLSMATYLS